MLAVVGGFATANGRRRAQRHRFHRWIVCRLPADESNCSLWAAKCKVTGTAFFMKQMGSVFGPNKGHELPLDLDIRQFPEVQL